MRPSGKDGLVAGSLPSFAEYQQERAWTWEHMALTPARPVYGSVAGRASLQRIVDGILLLTRDPAEVTADAAKMRAEMAPTKLANGHSDLTLGARGPGDLASAPPVRPPPPPPGPPPH